MPVPFVTRERPVVADQVPVASGSSSTEALNRTNADSVRAFEAAYGKPITNDAELAEAKEAYFKKVDASIAEYAANMSPDQPLTEEEQTLLEEQQAALETAENNKSMFDKLKEGCSAKPFGPVCSMCTKFPNDQAYADLLDSALNKAANAIAFSKVFGEAFKGDASILKQLGLCALNITRSATAGVRALAVAKAMVCDPKSMEALATIVLQRGGWLDPLDFMGGCVNGMADTSDNIAAVIGTCNSPYYGGSYYPISNFYSCRPFPLSDRVAYDMDGIGRLTRRGTTVSADALMVSDPNARLISSAVLNDMESRSLR